MAIDERKGMVLKGLNSFTHPVPNYLSEPSVGFEVTLEGNSLSDNNGRQGLDGNGQISWKKREEEMFSITVIKAQNALSEPRTLAEQ